MCATLAAAVLGSGGARLGPILWSAGRHTPVTRDNGSRSTALASRRADTQTSHCF